jgi:hypothetical protein
MLASRNIDFEFWVFKRKTGTDSPFFGSLKKGVSVPAFRGPTPFALLFLRK